MTAHVTQRTSASGGSPEVLLVAEAAEIARVSTATIRAEVRAGRLLAVRVGSGRERAHVRVSRAALMTWLGLHDSHGETIPMNEGGAPRPVAAAPAPRAEVARR